MATSDGFLSRRLLAYGHEAVVRGPAQASSGSCREGQDEPLCQEAGGENAAVNLYTLLALRATQLGLRCPLQGQSLGSGHSDGAILLAPSEAWAPFPHGHSDSWGQSCCHGHRVQLGDAPS